MNPPVPARLRRWQSEALAAFRAHPRRDFLVCASPGAGKTTMALAAARAAFDAGQVDQLVVVCPSDHLRTQWADAAAAAGLPLDPDFSNSTPVTSPQFCGIAVTYAQVAAAPDVHRAGASSARTFVILDEIHHAGDDKHWGDAIRSAYEHAAGRLALSGTPWRSDTNPIPFVTYAPDSAGVLRSVADYSYGYTQALADKIVRPVLFLAYSGHARWSDSAGTELEAHLDDPMTGSALRHAWRTALDPAGDWIEAVLAAANARLDTIRSGGMPDAGGLVIASNKTHAYAYAKLLTAATGQPATVVTSDNPKSSALIETFRAGTGKWLVAVRQVSEGVDIPRLAVCVYATNIATPLFFTQAVGRVIRARAASESASVFLPSVAPLLQLAAELETERDHALSKPEPADGTLLDDAALALAAQTSTVPDTPATQFRALAATGHLDRVIYSGTEHGAPADAGSAVEQSWLTLPGLLDADDLIGAVQARAGRSIIAADRPTPPVPLHRQVSAARRELHGLVGALHHRTGAAHSEIHARLRAACGGPQSAAATLEQLHARIAAARSWM